MREMQTPRVSSGYNRHSGVAWFIRDVGGVRIVQHDGGTNGQVSLLLTVPEKTFALTVLTAGDSGVLLEQVTEWVLERYLGIKEPEPARLQLSSEALGGYAGRFESAMDTVDLTADGGSLTLAVTPKGGFPTKDSPPHPAPPPGV